MELTGADIFVQCLRDEGVEYVFGYPGGAVLHIYDALAMTVPGIIAHQSAMKQGEQMKIPMYERPA